MKGPDLSVRVAQLEAQLAEVAVERALERQTLERLRRALELDGATGAHSRLFFEAQLVRALHQARRDAHGGQAGALTLGRLEIDGFADLRDGFGHQMADAALREVVSICRQVLRRQTDVVARLGGDAFAFLLPQTTLAAAAGLAEAIRREVAATTVGSTSLSVSIGVAAFPAHAQTAGALLTAAERALGRAKQSRNTVTCND